jgi:serine/threonine protein phosphatase PrpC
MTEVGASSVAGPRPSNEDGFLTIDLTPHGERLGGLRALLVVTDGMGGHANGELASRRAIEAAQAYMEAQVARAVADPQVELEPADLLWDLIGDANSAVVKAIRQEGGAAMGCTIVAALVGQDRAWVGHIGDSRVYHLRPSGIKRVTTDHSRVARMVAEGIITESQADDHPQRNVVERALGFEGALPDFGKVWLEPGDALVLATDGLYTALGPGDILAVAASAETASSAAEMLTAAAVTAGTDDNTTVVVWGGDWWAFHTALANAGVPLPEHVEQAGQLVAEPAVAIPALATPASATPASATPAAANRRAQLIFLVALAVVLVAGGLLAFVATRSAGGGSGGVVATVQTTGSVVDSAGAMVLVEVKATGIGANLRSSSYDQGEDNWVGRVKEGVRFNATPTSASNEWYAIAKAQLGPEDLKEGTYQKFPGIIYIFGKNVRLVSREVPPATSP